MISRGLLPAVVLWASSSTAFTSSALIFQQRQRTTQRAIASILRIPLRSTATSSSSISAATASDDAIRRDIEAMREEAQARLQSLQGEMEDILARHNTKINDDHHQQTPPSISLDAATLDLNITTEDLKDAAATKPSRIVAVEDIPTDKADRHPVRATVDTQHKGKTLAMPKHSIDSRLLHDTSWNVVVKVGSAKQNAMLEGSGEKNLMVHLIVDFSAEPLQDHDELLHSQDGEVAKVLQVRESWIGASSTTQGQRRSVKIQSTGGWKILPCQGPKGIDILRFYVDVDEEICHDPETSHLRCPAKRIYCTCGVFSMEHHNESEAYKDQLRKELDRLVSQYDDLCLEEENDERIISFEQMKRARQLMNLRAEIKATTKNLTNARIRNPEKSLLRLSRRGDIGVTREGQVCYRETMDKNLGAKYLVLGKFEAASVDRPELETLKTTKEYQQ